MAGAATNIGAATSSFVGREAVLDELSAALGSHRLVTLLGPAGVGKTRLAEELARRESASFPGGSFLCELAAASTRAELCAAVAGALDVPLVGDDVAKAERQLARALDARGHAIIVLDNLEQLLPLVAPVVAAWHAAARHVRFVVTSRRPTRVPGEVLFELAPLALPEGDADAAESPAVRLFLERARAEVRGHAPRPEDLRDAAEIVRRLDGVPFAIELAAARLRVLGTGELARRLRDGFGVLGSAMRKGRGASLDEAIGSSWELLREVEREALAQASVFRGGFTLEAAAAVIRPTAKGKARAADPLDLVQALVDHSLVQASATRDGERRFRLLESVRAFAAHELDALAGRGATEARARHAAHFLALEDPRTIAREVDNLLGVFAWALEAGDAACAMDAALTLDGMLVVRGPAARRLEIATQASNVAGAFAVPAKLTRVLLMMASAALDLGLAAESAAHVQRACDLAGESAGAAVEGPLVEALARQALHEGRVEEARNGLERALALHVVAADARAQARARALLGDALARGGDVEAARSQLLAALDAMRPFGDKRAEAHALASLADLDQELGLLAEARARADAALAVHTSIGDRGGEARLLVSLGAIDLEEGRVVAGADKLARAIQLHREIGDTAGEAIAIGMSGSAAELAGEAGVAEARYEAAIAAHRRAGRGLFEALTRCSLARVAARRGDAPAAYAAVVEAEALLAGGRASWETVAEIARAEIAMTEGSWAEAEALLASAKAPAARSAEVRRALEAATTRLRHAPRGTPQATEKPSKIQSVMDPVASSRRARAPEPTGDALTVATSGRWYRPPRGEAFSLATRRALRLLVKTLADRRDDAPGEATTWEGLLAAGWPGERVHPTAGASRVYAAIASLRRDGLRNALVRRDDGYLFDPAVPLVRADDDDPRGPRKKA